MSLEKKLLVVGDGACGKTCLLIAFTNNSFDPDKYVPTVFDTHVKSVQIADKIVELSLWDTAGQEDYDNFRKFSYEDANIVLICFSVVDRTSFENIPLKWAPEVKQLSKKSSIILVGTKGDLREKEKSITKQEAESLATKIGAARYIECSAKTMFNVEEVFKEGAKAALDKKKKTGCSLM